MNWLTFENDVCSFYFKLGYWAHRIQKDERGAQPFDVIAIRGRDVIAVDCKVCSRKRFPLSRVEDNQWLSMELMQQRTKAFVGFLCHFGNKVYVLPFSVAKAEREAGAASIPLEKLGVLFEYEGEI